MNRGLAASFLFVVMFIIAPDCPAQTDPKNVSKPPAAELEKFKPFLGDYAGPGDSVRSKWIYNAGFRSAIKGWYVEFYIFVNTDGTDREFRVLMTYDTNQKKYRAWRFETLVPLPQPEGELRFEGDEIMMEWKRNRPNMPAGAFRNRCRMTSKDELEIITETQGEDGKMTKLGALTLKRKP